MYAKPFKVRKDESSPQHKGTVNVPTYAEMNEAQRRRMVEKGVQSVIIDMQGGLRRDLGGDKPLLVKDLTKRAQERFDAILNDKSIGAPATIIDATQFAKDSEMDLTVERDRKMLRKQIDVLVSNGAEVRNIPQGV